MINLIQGDCLERMKEIPSGSVDMILTDPPYGTTACKWDSIIPLEPMWEQLKRIIKPNGAIVMTASQPFTTTLIASNMKMFKYTLVWDKKFGIPAHARFRPMKTFEDLVVFCDGKTTYNPQMVKRDKPIRSGGNKCNSETAPMGRMDGFKKTYREKFPVSILEFKRDLGRTVHPTQKPVSLMEYLIKTYTDENETVLDFTMGSGSTGVAAKNLNRNFIGIELDEGYFNIAKERINNTK